MQSLPQFDKIKEQFNNDVNIVLVSNQKEKRLHKYINSKKVGFPLIVDTGEKWNGIFTAPSLPYTVVVKEGKIIAKKGIREILKKYNIISQQAWPSIRFKTYDWELQLNNYKT